MDMKLAFPAFGALLISAAALGVHMGQSAVGGINPLYFQGPAVHPRDRGVVVDESALVEQGPRFAQLYGWEQGLAARDADCVNCDALAARDAYAARPVHFARIEAAPAETRQQAYAPDPHDALTPVEAAPDAYAERRAEVVRYTSYAIEAAPDPEQPAIDAVEE